jgi:hypothetical protein
MRKDVTDNMFEMLTTVGIRVQDIKLLDGVQELFEVDMDATAIIDSGATRTIVPNDSYLLKGSVYELKKPVLFKGFDKNGKAQSAKYAGMIAIRSNTSLKGHLLLTAYILPWARRPLISMSQLDEGGNYVDMGGGGMRLRRGYNHSNFLSLPRLEPELAKEYARDLKRECQTENDVQWDYSEQERSSLYPIPLNLFRTHPFVGESDEDESEQVQVAEAEVSFATRYSQK